LSPAPELIAELRATRRAQPRAAEAEVAQLEAMVRDEIARLKIALAGEPDAARRGLRALLGERRLAVYADPELGFRVEGTVRLRLGSTNPPAGQGRRAGCADGSGGAIPVVQGTLRVPIRWAA
jgi:hypothetical protein